MDPHKKLKEIERQRNLIGVGGYRNSRRERSERHENFCKTMKEIEASNDKRKLYGTPTIAGPRSCNAED